MLAAQAYPRNHTSKLTRQHAADPDNAKQLSPATQAKLRTQPSMPSEIWPEPEGRKSSGSGVAGGLRGHPLLEEDMRGMPDGMPHESFQM